MGSDGTARVGTGIRGLIATHSFRATGSSTVPLAGDSIRRSLRSTPRSSLAKGASITTLTLTAEAGIMVGTMIRTCAAADIMPGTGTRDRTPEALAAERPAADTTEVQDSAEVMAEASMVAGCREADFTEGAGSGGTAAKRGNLSRATI